MIREVVLVLCIYYFFNVVIYIYCLNIYIIVNNYLFFNYSFEIIKMMQIWLYMYIYINYNKCICFVDKNYSMKYMIYDEISYSFLDFLIFFKVLYFL